MEPNYQEIAKVLKALSDPKRLRIVNMLAEQDLGASRILQAFDITQPTLSHDMHVLLSSGLVTERRMGKNVIYSLDREAVARFGAQIKLLVYPA